MKKENKNKILKSIIATGVAGGMIAGGAMLVEMDKHTTATVGQENMLKRAESRDTYQALLKEQDELVWLAFDNKIINADDFTRLMKANHSGNFAYEHRYELLSETDAIAWENFVSNQNKAVNGMVGTAIASGTLLGAAGLALIKKYEMQEKANKENEEEMEK